ncbi:alpha/beta fold hydrolase [Oerskovia sp. M15]
MGLHPRYPALAHALIRILDALELEKVVLVGNSMGCPVSLEVAHSAPDRVDRIVLVSPAGGVHNQGLGRAIRQLAMDGPRESRKMARVAVPDYVRFGPINTFHLFSELTRFPSWNASSRRRCRRSRSSGAGTR